MIGTGQDITEQKAAEAELRQQQEFSAALLKAQSDLGEALGAACAPIVQRNRVGRDAMIIRLACRNRYYQLLSPCCSSHQVS
jgi:hypothetical protein